jgi:hypothetical protein
MCYSMHTISLPSGSDDGAELRTQEQGGIVA